MKLGAGELLLVVLIIVILVALSRAKKTVQEVKRETEAARPARKAVPVKPPIKYPQLQLLGILVMLVGVAMAAIGYLLQEGVISTLSVAGIAVLVFGIAFIILARRR
ncbi:hypothetical protein [Dehalogenimonas sp. 4OHTPN]|uniref:Uncharacterized protein n=1 Tax=Dehalogenimonas sp. 4OHTPN TaxID=3166643 RepID=A0AAU8G831_9CHLR